MRGTSVPEHVVPTDLPLLTPKGEPTTLGEHLVHDLTIVHLVRYFGCLPCQEWLVELNQVAGQLATQGVGAIAIGGSADYQAVWLKDEKGVGIPLLLDPEQQFRQHVDADKPLGWRMMDPRGAAAYARTLGSGYRPQAITRDTVRSPGVVVLDRTGRVRWRHIGTRIGHYPPLDEVVEAAVRIGSPGV